VTAAAERCSTVARVLAEPLAGTAPLARTWVALEQPGPWGNRALTQSHLDPGVGADLTARSDGTGVTVVLVRRPGHHADATSVARETGTGPAGAGPRGHGTAPPRALWIAHTGVEPWLLRATVTDPAVLLDLDFGALAAGTRPALGEPDAEALLLVCTNSRRDECCALIGRPLAAELAATWPGRVWESSHLGGHRLAPVVLSLPDGFVFGGPRAASLSLSSCRGRSTLDRPGQAAELAELAELNQRSQRAERAGSPGPAGHSSSTDPRPRALVVEPDGDDWLVADPVSGGAAVRYSVTRRDLAPARKESCLKGPVSSVAYEAVRIGP